MMRIFQIFQTRGPTDPYKFPGEASQLILIIVVILIILHIGLAIKVYFDARTNKMIDTRLWVGVVLLSGLVGYAIYYVRKRRFNV